MSDKMIIVKSWQLYFEERDGVDNKFNAISTFANFWDNFSSKIVIFPEKFVIGGITDDDGDLFFSSHIACIQRVKHQFKGDLAHDLFRAVANDGEEFFFYSDEHTPEMRIMIGDMLAFHQLSPYSAFCPKPDIPGRNFI